ncbi:MAG: long-chain fatty acid--CoA ligase, partial [Lachnospiraceae bacterium]|nr:long-chain fatty acid--CoA ligase [Lachnospiraceae bacterium]
MADTMKVCNTISEILTSAEARFGAGDAIRYKVSKNEIGTKSYTQLNKESESFSRVLESLG